MSGGSSVSSLLHGRDSSALYQIAHYQAVTTETRRNIPVVLLTAFDGGFNVLLGDIARSVKGASDG